jgi:Domain of unknown function (DUF4258)
MLVLNTYLIIFNSENYIFRLMFDLILCKRAIAGGNYEWRKHTLQRMAERDVLQADVIEVILQGELIKRYDADKPFPSALFFKTVNQRPLHVVVAINKAEAFAFIVTVYEPSLEIFEPDFKTKKKTI